MDYGFKAGMLKAADMCAAKADALGLYADGAALLGDKVMLQGKANAIRTMGIEILEAIEPSAASVDGAEKGAM